MSRLPAAAVLALAVSVAVVGPAAATQGASGPPAQTPPAADVVVPSAVIVQWRADVAEPARDLALRAAGLLREDELPLPDTELVAVPRGQSAQAVAQRLSADPRVAFAEVDSWLESSSDDPFFGVLWGLDNTGQTIGGRPGVPGLDIGAVQARQLAAGRPGAPVVVAVTDSGVETSHPDLITQLAVKPSEPFNGRDDDGNGLVDDVLGWNFVTGSPFVYDDPTEDAHGTHVAGTLAAATDNRTGIAGATERARLMTVKFIGTDGGPVSRAVRAVQYASANGALVINASWGGPDSSQALQQALAASPAVVVAAAGNEGKDNDLVPEYPASYPLGNVVSVAAVDNVGRLASFSNRGALSVDLAAPGADIGSTLPNGSYGIYNGTSMAAPYVSAVAATVRSLRPDLSAAQVVSLLKSTVQPLASLRTTTSTGGLLDAEAAVRAALAGAAPLPAPSVVVPPTSTSEPVQAQPEQACRDGLPSAPFADVVDNVHADAIDCAVFYDLLRGTSASTFSPGTAVTRGQVASVLAGLVQRAGRLPATAPDAFTDDDGGVHEASTNRLASLGVVRGVGGGRFAPNAPVTRGQFATLLVGVHELLTRTTLPRRPTPFLDVPFTTHQPAIEKAYTAGLVRGTSATAYAPQGSTRRDQSASLVVRELEVLVTAGVVQSKGS